MCILYTDMYIQLKNMESFQIKLCLDAWMDAKNWGSFPSPLPSPSWVVPASFITVKNGVRVQEPPMPLICSTLAFKSWWTGRFSQKAPSLPLCCQSPHIAPLCLSLLLPWLSLFFLSLAKCCFVIHWVRTLNMIGGKYKNRGGGFYQPVLEQLKHQHGEGRSEF